MGSVEELESLLLRTTQLHPVRYLVLPEPEGTPKGSLWLIDEYYVAASMAGGRVTGPRRVPE